MLNCLFFCKLWLCDWPSRAAQGSTQSNTLSTSQYKKKKTAKHPVSHGSGEVWECYCAFPMKEVCIWVCGCTCVRLKVSGAKNWNISLIFKNSLCKLKTSTVKRFSYIIIFWRFLPEVRPWSSPPSARRSQKRRSWQILSIQRSFSVSANRFSFFPSYFCILFLMSCRGLKTRISTRGQTAWLLVSPDTLGASPPPLHPSVVEKFLQTIGRLEDLRDFTVQLANNFVDGLLPWWVCILSSHDSNKELSKSYLGYLQEPIRYLCRRTTKKTQTVNDEEQINIQKNVNLRGFGHDFLIGKVGSSQLDFIDYLRF